MRETEDAIAALPPLEGRETKPKPVDEMTLEELFEGVTVDEARALAEATDPDEGLSRSPYPAWLKATPLDETPGGLPAMSDAQEAVWRETNKHAFDALRARRRQLLTELHEAGWTLEQLGKLYGCSKQRAHKLLREPSA